VEHALAKPFSLEHDPILIPAWEQMYRFRIEAHDVKVGIIRRAHNNSIGPRGQCSDVNGRVRIEVEAAFVGLQDIDTSGSESP
jgi:hypothetical protein